MTEELETIDPVEFLRNSAIKWQDHARLSYALIEIYRDGPEYFDNRDILLTQEALRAESTVAMERLFRYLDELKSPVIINGKQGTVIVYEFCNWQSFGKRPNHR